MTVDLTLEPQSGEQGQTEVLNTNELTQKCTVTKHMR